MLPVERKRADYREPPAGDEALAEAPGDDEADPAAAPEADAVLETRTRRIEGPLHQARLDLVLVAMAPEFSRSRLQQLVTGGHVRLDGQPATTPARRVRAGQQVALDLVPTAESQAFRPQPMALAVLHEDDDLLVLDKPAGLVVHPAPGHWSGTLLNGLLAHHAAAAALPRAGIVHRLDKDTSGVMMVGKTLAAVTALVRDIAAREVHRRYLALAWGLPAPASFRIDAPIGRDPVSRVRMAVVAGGRPARTDVHCVAARDGLSALSCTLHTGRTHQIRVHLASRGHALVADTLYGGAPALGLQRQALHAFELRLAHPRSRAALHFVCPPPPDFALAWAAVSERPPA
ncbi:MAG: RluA family pseudouridine synthase [Burkholderiales bacterium]|nr:RluA family pseudouridine synthase [Burkholderiales bacterium]